MINLPFFKVLKMDIPTHIKYWIIKNKQIPKHLLEIIDQTPPITLENTLELPLENFKIIGKTFQNSLSGKNLLMSHAEAGTIKDVAFSINDDGTIIANGLNDGTGNSQFFINKYADGYTLPAGSYIINGCPSGGGLDRYRIGVQTIIDGSYNTLAVDTGSGASFTLTETTTLIVFIIVQKNYNANNLLFKPMIRLASVTDDNYESYCGGQPSPNPEFPQAINNVSGDITISVSDENNTNSQEVVFPLAEGQKLMEGDYLAEDGVHYVRGKVVFDGSENWVNYSGSYDGRFYCTTKYFGIDAGFEAPRNFKCTHFTPSPSTTVVNGISSTKYATYINADIEKVTDLSSFKTWLASNNITVEYKLATETIDPYTPAQATKFEEIKALTGYNNITIVNATSNDLAPNVSLKYYAKGWR